MLGIDIPKVRTRVNPDELVEEVRVGRYVWGRRWFRLVEVQE